MPFMFLHIINIAILVMQERDNNQLRIAGIKQLLVALPKTRILSSGVAGIWTQDLQRPRLGSLTKLDYDPTDFGDDPYGLVRLPYYGLG